jgi:hypothetical protein
MKHTGHGSADLNEPKQSQPTPSDLAKRLRDEVIDSDESIDDLQEWENGCVDWPMSKDDLRLIIQAADLIEQQASALKEWQSKYEAEHRALLERVNFTGANELEKTAIIARQASALKAVEELCEKFKSSQDSAFVLAMQLRTAIREAKE